MITATARGDANRYKKAGQSNSVPFPTNNSNVVDVEPNADSGGVPSVDKEGDKQELANIAHGEEPKTHNQAMASPDAEEWLAAERYELDQLARLDTYKLTLLPCNRSRTG